jgi:hypothetical protein
MLGLNKGSYNWWLEQIRDKCLGTCLGQEKDWYSDRDQIGRLLGRLKACKLTFRAPGPGLGAGLFSVQRLQGHVH